ncbi:MAG: 50S ribosomal protein L3 N(5)-glutamine methyltransferase [Oxalobacteraceae bacterium]|nr:MAG: 50S ribosomal protein L3 N(5)-glutamine methyltransferase [Oxalobacteraceae bacterium]
MTVTYFSTLRDVLRFATTRFNGAGLFFGHGSTNAFDEAAYLLLHTLKLPLDRLDPFLDARLLPEEVAALLKVVERRAAERVPAAYITHEAWLGSYRFYVDERVIVPRSFIAELIPEQFSPYISDPDDVGSVLELCTGSGCLAVLLADAFDNAHVDALDLSDEALAVAQRNVDDYQMQDRITLLQSDLYDALLPEKRYNLIVSNPPYVNASSMAKLPPEYRCEPQMALAGGSFAIELALT